MSWEKIRFLRPGALQLEDSAGYWYLNLPAAESGKGVYPHCENRRGA